MHLTQVPPPAGTARKRSAMLVSGGLEHAGGIGRWAGYLQTSWTAQGLSPELEVIDTRGHGGALVAARAFAAALLRLIRLRARNELGLIHANLSVRGSTFRKLIVHRLARAMKVPFILHVHGADYGAFHESCPGPLRRAIRRMFQDAGHILVLGAGERDFVVRRLGMPPERVTILPNGVRRPPPRQARAAGAPCAIVFLGRLGERKGVPDLIAALRSPDMRARCWHATLAGDGEVDATRRSVEQAGIAGRVSLPGWIGQARASCLIGGSDILVLPSHSENFPISVVEGLAHGVAVIATPVGATAEILTDGVCGLLVPPGDVRALTAALCRLIDDPAYRSGLAEAGRRLFEARLDIDPLARQLARLHRQF